MLYARCRVLEVTIVPCSPELTNRVRVLIDSDVKRSIKRGKSFFFFCKADCCHTKGEEGFFLGRGAEGCFLASLSPPPPPPPFSTLPIIIFFEISYEGFWGEKRYSFFSLKKFGPNTLFLKFDNGQAMVCAAVTLLLPPFRGLPLLFFLLGPNCPAPPPHLPPRSHMFYPRHIFI